MRSLLVALVFCLVACSPASRPTPEVAPPPTVVRAQLRAGTSGDYPPLSVWKNDRAEGFVPALFSAFAATQKMDVAWTRFRWPDLASDFHARRFDVAADGITTRPERSIAGRFTVPFARGGAVLLVRRPAWAAKRASSAIDDVHALDRAELRIVVNRGGHLERVAHGLFHAATVTAIADNAGVREVLARGEADAAMTNSFEAPRWADGIAGIESIGPLTSDVTALWVRADKADLAEQLDSWLLAEEESGRLAQLRTSLIGPGAGPEAARPVSALLAATAERLALMPFVLAAKQRSGKAVEDTAQEDRVLAASAEAVAKAAATHRTTPPARELVDAFFRAQIEAAKVVQRRVTPSEDAPAFSLDTDLRPAIARISARMAFLLVRVPRGTSRESILAEARIDLADSSLDDASVDRVAVAIAALAAAP